MYFKTGVVPKEEEGKFSDMITPAWTQMQVGYKEQFYTVFSEVNGVAIYLK